MDRKNRVDQATFACRACGFLANADDNASHNIAARGETCGLRGVSHAPLPPHRGVWTEEPTQQPVGCYLQVLSFGAGAC
ncbi:hypothetical protein [Streptomyces sp. NPDC020681]|uniref:hypothetical protein n=1 Tax=Streptomyces sp. NPDC020681 TaxID=3365083 RepID=UPI0037A04BB3